MRAATNDHPQHKHVSAQPLVDGALEALSHSLAGTRSIRQANR